ncbi:low-affinity phosphate transporter [Thoreauomyces humboldtii]|nr:low-affinity phosphate transporter [Thoreauomyces humboldtii]
MDNKLVAQHIHYEKQLEDGITHASEEGPIGDQHAHNTSLKSSEFYPTLTALEPRLNRGNAALDKVDDDWAEDGADAENNTRFSRFSLHFHKNRSAIFFLLTVVVGLVIFFAPIPLNRTEQNALTLLICVSMLWALEVFPLFITALMVPFLVVVFRVMRTNGADAKDSDVPLAAADAMTMVFHYMMDPTIILLMGGFSLAAALAKHSITTNVATWLLTKVGNDPNMVLLAVMNIATFSSLWISNVAAPVLCFTVLQPILATLASDDPAAKALVIGVALASNIGGMGSPISSPQNAIAISTQYVTITWPQWLGIGIPVALVSNFLVWLVIVVAYKPRSVTPRLAPLPPVNTRVTKTQVYIVFVLLLTIALWCVASNSNVKSVFGGTGIISIIPIILLFGPGLLNKDDFNGFLWSVLTLAQGGIALGKAMQSSGLLKTIGHGVANGVEGQPVWVVALIFSVIVLVFATFVSHSVAAAVFCPILSNIGGGTAVGTVGIGHTNLLVMIITLMASGAMGLPISGFPNLMAYSLEDVSGKPFLRTGDFVRTGVPCSIVALLVILSLGFGLETAIL